MCPILVYCSAPPSTWGNPWQRNLTPPPDDAIVTASTLTLLPKSRFNSLSSRHAKMGKGAWGWYQEADLAIRSPSTAGHSKLAGKFELGTCSQTLGYDGRGGGACDVGRCHLPVNQVFQIVSCQTTNPLTVLCFKEFLYRPYCIFQWDLSKFSFLYIDSSANASLCANICRKRYHFKHDYIFWSRCQARCYFKCRFADKIQLGPATQLPSLPFREDTIGVVSIDIQIHLK